MDSGLRAARHVSLLTGHTIVIALIIVAVAAVALILPVLYERLFNVGVGLGERAAPAMFWGGLVILLLGIVSGFTVLDLVGGGLVALVIAGWLAVNYLAALVRAIVRFAPPGT
jgi:hypothetical protein